MRFQKEIGSGMIEILAPPETYYPDFEKLPLSQGDSLRRVKWRTKQNLDTIYLMAYAQTRGTYYLMLEDDVIAEQNYMQEIKQFVNTVSVSTPEWFILEFCQVGGIGKLFRSSDLIHFIVYVELFYKNMPIDWLMDSYLADRVCSVAKSTDPRYGKLPLFFPHSNPAVKYINVTIKEKGNHTAKNAYEGKTFFWGIAPRKNEVIEFWFKTPIIIYSYTFRSGNNEHKIDKFRNTVVEVYPKNTKYSDFFIVDHFDEFGLADGKLNVRLGPLFAIRIRVLKDSFYWTVLSEYFRTRKMWAFYMYQSTATCFPNNSVYVNVVEKTVQIDRLRRILYLNFCTSIELRATSGIQRVPRHYRITNETKYLEDFTLPYPNLYKNDLV